jgi:hypothetical protein
MSDCIAVFKTLIWGEGGRERKRERETCVEGNITGGLLTLKGTWLQIKSKRDAFLQK